MALMTVARGTAARLGVRPVPFALDFEVTHRCNSRCSYCDRRERVTEEMTLAQICSVLDQFHDLGMRHVSLDGGEPLLRREIDEIVSFLTDLGVRVYMNTNGSLIPRKLPTVRRLARVKISLDGPHGCHDHVRGDGAFDSAVRGAQTARDAGTQVQLTCVIGHHNADAIDELLDLVEEMGFKIIFQPARNSLFVGQEPDGPVHQLGTARLNEALARVIRRKHNGGAVANMWSSLRHFRTFPGDTPIPCAAGWIGCTLEPDGTLHHCGELRQPHSAQNVVRRSVRRAFESLKRVGCEQCWCARVVEQNYAWGGRFDKLLPPQAR